MSTEQLRSLLDEMLSEVDERREAGTRAERAAPPPDEEPPPVAVPADDGSAFSDVEELRALDDVSFCKVLAACPRDHLLTVLSGASKGLQRKILTNLSSDSVTWLQKNLEYFDEPTRALLSSGRAKLLDVANRLAEGGAIALPGSPESQGSPSRLPDELEAVGAALVELLALVEKNGVDGLSEVVSAGGDPLLEHGLKLVAAGADEAEIVRAIDSRRAAAIAAFTRRLALIREGVLALSRKESPESFRKRLGQIGE